MPNVGIGTTAPAAGLDINTSGTTASAIIVPRDTVANRPSSPVNGMIRYASDTNAFEGYQNGSWSPIPRGFMGKLTMAPAVSCAWSLSSPASWTTFNTPVSNCNAATVSGSASAPVEGKIPAIKFATLPPGNYEVDMNIMGYDGAGNGCTFRIWDGTNFGSYRFANAAAGVNNFRATFTYASARTNIEFYLQAVEYSGADTCTLDNSTSNTNFIEMWVTGI